MAALGRVLLQYVSPDNPQDHALPSGVWARTTTYDSVPGGGGEGAGGGSAAAGPRPVPVRDPGMPAPGPSSHEDGS
jgi:hypothetical protein